MHLTTWQKGANWLSHRVAVARRRILLPRGVLSVGFDDFPRSAWTEGGPVLAAHGARATFFASGGLCGVRWRGLAQFTDGDLAAAHAAGHEIGCHSFGHESAAQVSAARMLASIARNRVFLAERLDGYAPRSFAWPYGHAAPQIQWRASRRFACCRGVRAGLNGNVTDASLLRGVGLERRQRGLHDLPALIACAAAERRWLILFTHDVQDDPTDYGCTPAELDAVLARARREGLDIAPEGEVMARRAIPAGHAEV